MVALLSVIIPCYNNGKYLVKMIDCFRHQTSPDWEMIIVDDGSSDDTPSVVKDCIKDLPNVYYLERNREPKGSVVCRNIGCELSKGKYVCHLDADDLVSKTFVEKRVAFMEAHPNIDYASFPAKSFSDENILPTYETKTDTFGVGKDGMDLLKLFLRADYPFSVWNNIYRKEAIMKYTWDETVKIYTDFSFIVPCILSDLRHSFSGLKEVDYYYRVTVNNKVAMTTNFVSSEKCDSTIYLFNKTLCQLEKRDDSNVRKRQFSYFIMLQIERLMTKNQKDEADRLVSMLSKHYSSFFIYRLKLSYAIASHFDNFGIRRNVLFSLYIILFQNSNYIKRIFEHFSR